MKLKIVLAIFFAALIVIFAWYYVNTGQNPMAEIKSKVTSLVDKYYDQMRSDYSTTHTPKPAKYTVTDQKTFKDESESKNAADNIAHGEKVMDSDALVEDQLWKANREQESSILEDKSSPDAAIKQDTDLKGKPSDHETGHITLFNTHPNVQMMNALHAKADTIAYDEGALENARMTFYREARPNDSSNEKFTVLFLHDSGLTSAIWINIGTFEILAELGYRALAVDLPGHGNSKDGNIPYSRDEILGYMTNLLAALKLHLPVLVSPGKSGEYAMPLVMAYPHVLRGLVAIAPSDTSHYSTSEYKKLTVPLLAMFGEKDDTMLKSSSLDSLFYVPNRKIFMVKNTTHSCYLDHPPTFHKLLLQFLNRVKQ